MSSGGGGGGQTTNVNTNIPTYARPYVENMLEAGQRQLFDTDPETNEIKGFREYKPYSSNPQDYFAGQTGLQTNVYNEAAGMQTPGVFNQAQGLAGAAGQAGLGAQGTSKNLMDAALGYGAAGSQ